MYKTSGQLKQEARNSLQGRWKEAVILNLVPSLLQMISMFLIGLLVAGMFFFISMFVTSSSFESFESQSNVGRTNIEQMFDEDFFEDEVDSWYQEYNDDYSSSSSSIASAAASASSSSFMAPIMNLVISFLMIGISFTFLDVVRKGKDQSMEFKDAFRVFNGIDFIPIFLIRILTYIFTALWSLLFVIPGIIKSYSYSQSYFIYKDLATHKDVRGMGATSFISESRDLMHGHKGRLFWLDVSFIGWYLLGFLTLGIGLLWINPYVTTTKAAFYNDLAKDKYLSFEEVEEEDEEWTSF